VRNVANYYVEPKATSVAVALLQAKIKPDLTADLNQVYANPEPQAYPLSSYSYMVIPKDTTANFNTEKGPHPVPQPDGGPGRRKPGADLPDSVCKSHGHIVSPTALRSASRWTSITSSTASRLMLP
jgi:PBP superfamily domain